jgi:hypothetical protein
MIRLSLLVPANCPGTVKDNVCYQSVRSGVLIIDDDRTLPD